MEWGDVSRSPFLLELRDRSFPGLLSIKFNVDGYTTDFRLPEFTRGRIVGTIGPASVDEPHHFVRGRQFMTATPGPINFCTAVVDPSAGKVLLDLGNALPTDKPGGALMNLGTLELDYSVPEGTKTKLVPLGRIPYWEPGWYERTAGIAVLPADRRLSDQELQDLAQNPLVLQLPDPTGKLAPAISEWAGGLYVRADKFVFRLNPGETAEVRLFATQFGQPYAGARVLSFLDPNGLQPSSLIGTAPPVAIPESSLDFPARVVTDADGLAILPITVADPGNPRGYIDGQVYGVRSALEETLSPLAGYPFDNWNFVSLLVFDAFTPAEPITWYGDIEPILQQAANLYPVMSRLLDLGDYESVRANRRLLQLAFGLDESDPNYMPVTRDLSKAKRQALLRWLADDPPLLGKPPSTASRSASSPGVPAAQESVSAASPDGMEQGSKAEAASSRLGQIRYRR